MNKEIKIISKFNHTLKKIYKILIYKIIIHYFYKTKLYQIKYKILNKNSLI